MRLERFWGDVTGCALVSAFPRAGICARPVEPHDKHVYEHRLALSRHNVNPSEYAQPRSSSGCVGPRNCLRRLDDDEEAVRRGEEARSSSAVRFDATAEFKKAAGTLGTVGSPPNIHVKVRWRA